jgi:hypothetical protein
MTTEKRCKSCGQTKPLDEFYKNPKMSDGHVNTCKTCYNKKCQRKRDEQQATNGPRPLESFTPRQLMQELQRRGFRGKLMFTQEIDITKL